MSVCSDVHLAMFLRESEMYLCTLSPAVFGCKRCSRISELQSLFSHAPVLSFPSFGQSVR